jgi:hypothetical protein
MKSDRIMILPPLPKGEVLPNGWVSISVITDAKAQARWADGLADERAAERAKDVTPKREGKE